MPALRTLGILILSLMAVSVGFLGYIALRGISEGAAAREAAARVCNACQAVINAGGKQTLDVYLPGSFTMRLGGKSISVDGYSVPEGGLALEFAGEYMIPPGGHRVSIWENGGRLVVEWT